LETIHKGGSLEDTGGLIDLSATHILCSP